MTAHHVATVKVFSTNKAALLEEVSNIQEFVAAREGDIVVFTETTIHPGTEDKEVSE